MELTKWAKELKEKYNRCISNSFLITGNIGDYAYNNILVLDYLLEFLYRELKMDEVATFDMGTGTMYSRKKDSNNGEPIEVVCSKLMTNSLKRAYIIRYPEFIVPQSDFNLYPDDRVKVVELHRTLSSTNFLNSNNIVIFLTESTKNINSLFLNSNSKTAMIDIELPDEQERSTFINYILTPVVEQSSVDQKYNNKLTNMMMDVTKNELTMLTAGLNKISIEDIVLLAIDEGRLTRDMVLNRKKDLIRKEFGEIIEIMDTEGYSLNKFAGQEHIKNYFKEVVIDAIKDDEISIVPKGVLLMGPPGTGKTYFSKCLAGDAGINFVEFKMSKILDKYVGESEKRLEKAFSVFRALSPVGVFIDEADQALSRGDQDTVQVTKTIFGMFLAELSKPENRGKIIWLAATNYPNKLDEALKRAGRFDKKIPFFAPTLEEREAVFKIHLKNSELPPSSDIDYNLLASRTEGYTQAEIENIVVKALELCKRTKTKQITQDKLNLALDYMLSAQNDKIKEMEDIALKECNDQEFIPEAYKERHKQLYKSN